MHTLVQTIISRWYTIYKDLYNLYKGSNDQKGVLTMKKIPAMITVLLLTMSVLFHSAWAGEVGNDGLTKDVKILYTSDVHCAIDQGWGYGGICAVKQSLARDYHVLLVDDGDAIQGEPIGLMTRGEAIIDIMNATGYDIAIPGNHEFDYGMDTFLGLAEKAEFPYISCNFNKEGELVFPPYVIREFDGIKIGFVGVTTPMTIRDSAPKYFMDEDGNYIYGFFQDKTGDGVYQAVQKAVDGARAEGADYVVVMAHMGNEKRSRPGCTPMSSPILQVLMPGWTGTATMRSRSS